MAREMQRYRDRVVFRFLSGLPAKASTWARKGIWSQGIACCSRGGLEREPQLAATVKLTEPQSQLAAISGVRRPRPNTTKVKRCKLASPHAAMPLASAARAAKQRESGRDAGEAAGPEQLLAWYKARVGEPSACMPAFALSAGAAAQYFSQAHMSFDRGV
jgi:hypothetical protein